MNNYDGNSFAEIQSDNQALKQQLRDSKQLPLTAFEDWWELVGSKMKNEPGENINDTELPLRVAIAAWKSATPSTGVSKRGEKSMNPIETRAKARKVIRGVRIIEKHFALASEEFDWSLEIVNALTDAGLEIRKTDTPYGQPKEQFKFERWSNKYAHWMDTTENKMHTALSKCFQNPGQLIRDMKKNRIPTATKNHIWRITKN